MKSLRQLIYLFAFALLLAACKGDDGDPGPQGDAGAKGDAGAAGAAGAKGDKGDTGDAASASGFEKLGSLEGTIVGTRQDGTAFSESFKYEYHSIAQIEGFTTDGSIYFDRWDTGTNEIDAFISFAAVNGTAITSKNINAFYVNFIKELSSSQLFSLNVNAFFYDREGFLTEITDLDRDNYRFVGGTNPNNSSGDGLSYSSNTTYSAIPVYRFQSSITGVSYYPKYRQDNGALIAVQDFDGNDLTSGTIFDLFNKLKFVNNPDLGIPTFYTTNNNTSLGVEVPDTAADEFTITNYSIDGTTGVITFDYEMKVSGYRSYFSGGRNTTYHDVTITGKFNSGGKVYSSIVGRKG